MFHLTSRVFHTFIPKTTGFSGGHRLESFGEIEEFHNDFIG